MAYATLAIHRLSPGTQRVMRYRSHRSWGDFSRGRDFSVPISKRKCRRKGALIITLSHKVKELSVSGITFHSSLSFERSEVQSKTL